MESSVSEETPLLPVVRSSTRKTKHSCFTKPCCIGSKAARLILLWNFAVLLSYQIFYNLNTFQVSVSPRPWLPLIVTVTFTSVAVLSPVAGLLTDIKFSRFKTVLYTSYTVYIEIAFAFLILTIFAFSFKYDINTHVKTTTLLSIASFVVSVIVTAYVVFIINGIQFGMDQLHDSPTEDSILYIHWYVWIYYICSLITQLAWNFLLYDGYNVKYIDSIRIVGLLTVIIIIFAIVFLLTVSLCVVHYRKVWFFLEPAGANPYKLVYRVVKFAYQHKIPLRRSAFTYCDEESPTRLDVGKHKFGGPFPTKQVEDVKAFWGILKVLITIGPAFLLQTVMQTILPLFAEHNNIFLNTTALHQIHLEGVARHILISNGLLSPLLIVICIPLYLCWIRPHITYYIPGMLKRIRIALVVMVLSFICTFVMDVIVHVNNTEYAHCMFTNISKDLHSRIVKEIDFPSSSPLYQNVYFFTTQHVLSALADMLYGELRSRVPWHCLGFPHFPEASMSGH